MNFTQGLKSLTKIALAALLIFAFCACSQKQLPQKSETAQGSTDDISFVQTSEQTNFVKLEMENGDKIIIELYPEIAPKTVANFKKLVSENFYDGLTFHRVVKDFVIQTGDPTGTGAGGSKETIFGEFGINGFSNNLSHKRGVVSMARLSNDYNSASSQFFICHADAVSLDGSYAAFGKVIAGMDTVDKIASVPVTSSKPNQKQVISTARFVNVEQ